MKWTVSHIPDGNIVLIETEGKMTVGLLNQMIKEAMKFGEIHKSCLFLVDHRKLHIALGVIDTYYRPKELDKLEFPRNSKIAQVAPESNIEKFKFFETVSYNKGYKVRIFMDIESARDWLSN